MTCAFVTDKGVKGTIINGGSLEITRTVPLIQLCVGVGLGLPGVKPGCNTSDLSAVLAQNDNNLTETQMLEDKIRFTDWEATNEAIEEQVLYLRSPEEPRVPDSCLDNFF